MTRTLSLLLVSAGLSMTALQEELQIGGRITGTPTIQWTHGVRLYRGIPYAAPPVGDLQAAPIKEALDFISGWTASQRK